ncbi:hypothetical protein HanHA300_Chr06g0215391 [Helianthus annuus]|nr:hypothetical protein HanHA300_Chr06g0215391 [Helianthus annuus]KAJ0573830.1 hypothetical protein HanHA89_Chr06g0231161 [Helianthus annuus]KAJ0738165.1 hypothetical protein HanLR1_Chr06g0215091 [Helianthus annuus]KAJ0741062.1 hypothetical protein HanOQP8_Chr06g0223721 [Helianthus annuus]
MSQQSDFWNDGIRKGLCCKSNVGKWPINKTIILRLVFLCFSN